MHSGSDSLTSPPQLSPNGQHPWADASDRAARPFELFNNGSSNGKLQAEDAHRRNHMARSAWNGTAAGGRTERQNFDLAETMRQFDQLYVSPDSASVAANTFGRSISYGNCEGVKQHQRMPHSPNSAPVLQKKNYEAAANCWSNPASRSGQTLNGRKQSANAWSYANYSNSLDTEASVSGLRSRCIANQFVIRSPSKCTFFQKANYFRPIVGQASESLSSPGSSNSSVSCEGSPVNGHVAYPNPEQAYNYANPRQQRAVVTCDEAELNWYHQQLELQQSIYEHFYNLLLCGQLPLPAGMNRSFANTRNTLPTSMQFARNNIAAGDLHQRLEQVTESYRRMEKERKKTEAELARHNLGKRISSANSLPIPRLPPAPSRVDRLVVDFFREHARMVTLLGKMEQLRGAPFDDKVHQVMRELLDAVRVLQQRRLNERTAILQQLRGDIGRYNEEKGELFVQRAPNSTQLSTQAIILEAAQLTLSLMEVNRCVIRARSANWCALMWTIGSTTEEQRRLIEEIVAANFSLEPPEIKLCAVPV